MLKFTTLVHPHRVHPHKVDSAPAFDPLLALAQNIHTEAGGIANREWRNVVRRYVARCGDSVCIEGYTWDEVMEKSVRAPCLPLLACTRPSRASALTPGRGLASTSDPATRCACETCTTLTEP